MQSLAEVQLEPVVAVSPHDTAADALERLVSSRATELYVVDSDQSLLGIVPDYELLKARLHGGVMETTVERIMSHHVVCFEIDARVGDVLKLFREGQHSRAAVVQGGKLVGQITRTTLLRNLVSGKPSATPRPKFLGSELARNALTLNALTFA